MKKLFILILLIAGLSGSAQNYTYIAQRYEWLAGVFRALGLPAGDGPAAFTAGQAQRAGAIYYDSTGIDSGLYVYSGLAWQQVGAGEVTQAALDDSLAALAANYFKQGGNNFGADAVIGTIDTFSIDIKANNLTHTTIQKNGSTWMRGTNPGLSFFQGTLGAADYYLRRSSTSFILNSGGVIINQISGRNSYRLSDNANQGHEWYNMALTNTVIMWLKTTGELLLGTSLIDEGDYKFQLTGGARIDATSKTIALIGLSTDNTATQVAGKDASGNLIWRDISSISGSGVANLKMERGGNGIPIWYVRDIDTTLILKDVIGETFIEVGTKTDSTNYVRLDTADTNLKDYIALYGGAGGGTWGSITGTLSDQTDLQSALDLKSPLASPTFTGTVTIPTPFTLGAVSVLPTGTELNFVDGVTSNIQTQLNSKVPDSGTKTIAGQTSLTGAVILNSTFASSASGLLTGSNFIIGSPQSALNSSSFGYGGATTGGYRVGMKGATNFTIPVTNSYGTFIVHDNPVTGPTSGTVPVVANGVFLPLSITDGAGAVTNATTVYIGGAPTGTETPTNPATSLWLATGDARFGGNINIDLTKKINIATGTNSSIGTATLAAGTVTVNTTAVSASSKIFITVDTPGGTQGFLSVPSASITAATSFVINSTSGTETSTVSWIIIN